ncbi:hypothetical protein C5688_13710 [Methylocystis sp. MitZ-2018]|nr:hypothetical protein C5688_13710 [Methylocystis sp. MitZ-2018]
MMTIKEAEQIGARAGLLGDGKPKGFEQWPGPAQAAYSESYARGRHCRQVAEGKERVAAPEPNIPNETTTREQLAAEFQRRADLQQEFVSEAGFIAYAMAERAGKARRITDRVAYSSR